MDKKLINLECEELETLALFKTSGWVVIAPFIVQVLTFGLAGTIT
jgi:hypothetical protein